MNASTEWVTVFRSADVGAESQARAVAELLGTAEIPTQLLDDGRPGVPPGAWEVRVPARDANFAERLIAEHRADLETAVNPSHDLDLVTVFASDAHNAEMEALAVRSLLEASGLPAVIVGTSLYPNLPFEVRVPRRHAAQAEQILREARTLGPAAVEEAEREGENC
ncbi:MAG: DUF2007 domain-containing protein [Bryobacteraceae bacterium]|nr:DUF2007 domain-containing protein [Bryobacteraceae bacterium]